MARTNLNAKLGTRVLTLAGPFLLCGIGTGGDSTLDYHRLREVRLIFDVPKTTAGASVDVISTANDLRYIRSVLKITASDLARVLGVSRQTLYNWKAGSYLKAQNLQKLENLKSASELFARERITISSHALNKKLPGGETFLDLLASGRSGTDSAALLINSLRDAAQRNKSLEAMFADNVSRKSDKFDYGAPAANEE